MNNESDFYLERSKIIQMCKLECDEDDDRKEVEESHGESEGESPKGDSHEKPPAKTPTPNSKTEKKRKRGNKRANTAVESGDIEHGDGDEVGEDQEESGLPPSPDADDGLPAMDLPGLGLEDADGGLPAPTPAPTPAKRSRT